MARLTRLVLVASVVATVGAIATEQGVAHAAGPDPQGTIYVSDESAASIDIFPPGTSGNVAPTRTISGSLTGINQYGPDDVKVSSTGKIYASNLTNNSITEYAPGASGNVAPICTISGSITGLSGNDDMSLASDGTLYVGNYRNNLGSPPVEVFAPGACGNVAPIRTIGGPATGLGDVDGVGVDATGTLYVDNTNSSSIEVFAPGATGNVAPIRTISGSQTGLGNPSDIVVGFNGKLYITDFNGSVLVFAPGASGNVAPLQDIIGSNTVLFSPDDLAVDSSGNIHVTDESSGVLEFSANATGNVAPISIIAGSSTTFIGPEGVFVAGPPAAVSASLTSSTSPSISLGSQTHDAATLSGGKTPTGSIIFKLFGPNDNTCSAAPAFTSPLTTVTGDGTYTSPSFTPTAAGTYRWVDLYSGDNNNAPVSTTCGTASETVNVGGSGPPPKGCSSPPTVKHAFSMGNPKSEIVRVLITGTCLGGATKVMFGSVAATSFTQGYGNIIQAVPPQQTAGTVDVTVTTPHGTSAINKPNDQYTYFLPTITQVRPSHGPVTGGNTVVIHGSMFSGTPAPTVSFGAGNFSSSVVVIGDGTIQALVPPHTSGTVDVQVTAFTGSSLATPADHYTYK